MTPVVVSSVPPMMSGQQFAAVLVDGGDQVGAVVHRHVRLVVEGGADVLVVGHVVFALDGKGRDFVDIDQRRCHIILGRERVGSGQHQVRAAGLQRARQVGGLGGDVQAGRKAHALERFLLREALAHGRRTGISRSAHSIRRRPPSARFISLISKLLIFISQKVFINLLRAVESWAALPPTHPTASIYGN